jgi:hypothetical protein
MRERGATMYSRPFRNSVRVVAPALITRISTPLDYAAVRDGTSGKVGA